MEHHHFSRRRHRHPQPSRRTWCCSFAVPPSSPDNPSSSSIPYSKQPHTNSQPLSKPTLSLPNSPQSSKSGSRIPGRIDPRRILSPGRVSPIDSDPAPVDSAPQLRSPSFAGDRGPSPPEPESCSGISTGGGVREGFDVRMSLRGKNGGCMVLELNSVVLCANSEVFARLIEDHKKGLSLSLSASSSSSPNCAKMCRIEVPEVDNLGVFRETIELMFEDEDNVIKRLTKIGVYRSIDVLEVSAGIMFTRGVLSCLKYLEAVPWNQEEEEKLRSLFTRFKFDDATTRDILGRLYLHDSADDSRPNVASQLVWSTPLVWMLMQEMN